MGEMAHAFPAAKDAILLDAAVVKQRNATFRCVPGAQTTATRPLYRLTEFIPGRGVDSIPGWPSTMESAVISGYNAAAAVMSSSLGADGPPE